MKKGMLFGSRAAMRLFAIVVLCAWLPGGVVWGTEAIRVPGSKIVFLPPPDLNPLNQTPVPEPPNLGTFVKNKATAIKLGKALFWDMQVGSDGIVACATCHHSAGVDKRLKNTLNPGAKAGDTVFGNNSLGAPGFPQFGPNYTLDPVNDFPFHQRATPADVQSSPIIRHTNDVVGSQGVRRADFVDVVPGSAVDNMTSVPDPVFNVAGANTRRVTGRNTPTMINAIYNFNNFWDGRAHFRFNGENPFGPADPNAGVWFNVAGTLVKQPVEIQFASLASQAVGPPLDDTEMSAKGRTFPQLGRKMLSLVPLGKQIVHPKDSELGLLSRAVQQPNGTLFGSNGLNTTYSAMIQAAFEDNLWNATATVNLPTVGVPAGEPFTQMEANFSLFWGLAIQLYVATLVSDQTPLDRYLGGDATALTEQQKLGFALFFGIANCTACHGFIEFTNASATSIAFINNFDSAMIDQMFVATGDQAIYDNGWNNTAVTPTAEDIGRGANSPFTNPLDIDPVTLQPRPLPLAYTSMAILQAQNKLPFSSIILPLELPINILDNKNGLFKVPSLRNVELTAPYFHNGSMMTLEDVMDFYVRGGNFPQANLADLDPIIGEGLSLLQGNEAMHLAMVAFMKSLTDPRVSAASMPFDHPELFIPEGDPEVLIRIAATDKDGVAAPPTSLTLNAVSSPTKVASQTISGTVQAGVTPTVTVNTLATVGPVTVAGTAWSCLISNLQDGDNLVRVTVVSGAPPVTTSVAATITVDRVSPALALNAVTSPTRSASQTISGTVEAGIIPTVTVGAPRTAGPVVITGGTNWSSLISNLQEGSNTFTVAATDAAGNAATLSTTITLDSTAPFFTINPVTTLTGITNQTISGTVEAGVTIRVSVNGGALAPATVTGTTWSFVASLVTGANAISVIATDSAGNTNTATLAIATISVIPVFGDVLPGSFAYEQIQAIVAAGITAGCSANPLLFCPNDRITRAQMAVFIETSLGNPPNACTDQFEDSTAAKVGAVFCGFIERFAADGITAGCGQGKFCPNDRVSRGQMAVFLEAALGNPPNACTGTVFADVDVNKVGAATCGFIERLAADGITSGCGGGNFCPNDPVTRAEMAVFLVAAPPPLLP